MKRFIALAAISAAFAGLSLTGCTKGTAGTNLGNAIDGNRYSNGYNAGYVDDSDMTGWKSGRYFDTNGNRYYIENGYGTGLYGTTYGDGMLYKYNKVDNGYGYNGANGYGYSAYTNPSAATGTTAGTVR